MSSFLLTGADLNARQKYITNLVTTQTEIIHLFAEKSTLTIKQIKDLQIPLNVSARLPRLVWIEEANLLTTPAQNALLKILEEPPAMTSFYLSCQSPAMLLPTIRSRTRLIALDQIQVANDSAVLSDLKTIMSQTQGDRLASIVKRDRSQTIVWLSQIESALKEKLHNNSLSKTQATTLGKIAKLTLQAHEQLLSNCSVSLVTQVFYLTLPHTRSTT